LKNKFSLSSNIDEIEEFYFVLEIIGSERYFNDDDY